MEEISKKCHLRTVTACSHFEQSSVFSVSVQHDLKGSKKVDAMHSHAERRSSEGLVTVRSPASI
jgi:hypothetical protein